MFRLSHASLAVLLSFTFVHAAELSSQDNLIIETLMRLESYDYANAKPRVKEAVGNFLEAKWGSDEAFDLLERFGIRDHDDQLLTLAMTKPTDTVGVHAPKLLLASNQMNRFDKVIHGDDPKSRTAALQALGFTGDPKAIALLASVVTDEKRPLAVRGDAIRALARSRGGEKKIIELATSNTLSESLHVTAAGALATSADPAIRGAAQKHLKTPAGAGGKALPPIGELSKRKGDPAHGKAAFMKVCFACHQVGDVGLDFGPKLTEIGDKLPKEGLYQAILEPSAGISFGFEGWMIKLKNGTELMGFIASQTETDLTLKMPGGVAQKLDKQSIASRTALPTSLMPPGLQAAISEQELIDLVEYLTTLRKAPPPENLFGTGEPYYARVRYNVGPASTAVSGLSRLFMPPKETPPWPYFHSLPCSHSPLRPLRSRPTGPSGAVRIAMKSPKKPVCSKPGRPRAPSFSGTSKHLA